MITQTNPMADLCDGLLPLLTCGDSYTFPKFIANVCRLIEGAIRESIKNYLENMDKKFKESPGRTGLYHIKDTAPRTIITMYGEITYTRTIYKDLRTGKRFCYVDSKMGIDKYIRYTNDVGSYVYDAYSDENSMIKVGEEIGGLIHGKYSLEDKRSYALPRQTIYNLIRRVKEIRKLPSGLGKEVVKDIYLLFDEKYIPCQDKLAKGETRKDMMVKSCLIVEGLDMTNKRHKYLNRYYLTLYDKDIASQLEDYLNNKYDMDKVERIHFLSDGGSWIKSLYKDISYPRKKKIKYLDKFHVFKSLQKIANDNQIYASLINLLFENKKDELFKTIDGLAEVYTQRKEIIENERKYLFNNYKEVKNILKLKEMNCSMEQVISHHIASHFTSVAKSYRSTNINRYLSMRDNYRNKENPKLFYLEGLNHKDEEVVIINKPHVDQSTFTGNQIYYEANSKTPKRIDNTDNPSCETGQEDYN